MQKNNGIIVYQFTVNLCTLLAFILQYIPIPEKYQFLSHIFVYIVIVLLLISIAISILSRNIYTRKRLTRVTKKLMSNAESIVMFGGDLTWATDYASTIRNLISNNKSVIIIFPKSKINFNNEQAKIEFKNNINELKNAGARIYYTIEDTGLRCTFIDINGFDIHQIADAEDLKIITSKRIYKNLKNGLKNKYRMNVYGTRKTYERPLCILYCKYFAKIQNDLIEYNERDLFNV